jgi:hypothetical protein
MNTCNFIDCKETLTKPNIMEVGDLKVILWLCITHQQILDKMKDKSK